MTTDHSTQESSDVEKITEKPTSRKRKALPIIIGCTVVAVVAVAGAGFMVWHEQPSFCNAICHNPMDPYVATLTDGSTDKFGNDLATDAEKSSMLSYAHANVETEESVECLGCHVPTLSEQISEGIAWITGDYAVEGTNALGQAYLESRTLDDLVEARGLEPDQFCMNDACHTNSDGNTMTRDDLVALTANEYGEFNPHEAVHEELACSTCHKAHTQSTNYCSDCHESEVKIPEGWLSYKEYEALSN